MAYDEKNKKLYATSEAGISAEEVAQCIGDFDITEDGLYDIGTLCSSPNINMWSKCKPICFDKIGVLTLEERRGSSQDIAKGVLWGIEIIGPTTSKIGSELTKLHDTTFDYHRPRGMASLEPFRLLDFDGYHQFAQPNPFGNFPSEELAAYCDDKSFSPGGSLRNIYVAYTSSNTTGVDLTELFDVADNETLKSVLSRTYPCILITDSDGKSYFTALDYNKYDSSTPGPAPLYDRENDRYLGGSGWSVRFEKNAYLAPEISGGTPKPPWSSNMTGRATLFLVKAADTAGPYLLAGNGMNFSECWIPVTANMPVNATASVLPSERIGIPISLTKYGAASVYFEPTNVIGTTSGLSVFLSRTGSSASTFSVTCKVKVEGDGIPATQTKSIAGNSVLPAFLFTPAELGVLAFLPNTTYKAQVSITTKEGSKETTKSATFEFTVN